MKFMKKWAMKFFRSLLEEMFCGIVDRALEELDEEIDSSFTGDEAVVLKGMSTRMRDKITSKIKEIV